MQAEKFDAIVIGAGSAGLAFATQAARSGASVLVIEKSELGGTCINRGCVPKKLMWEVARVRRHATGMRKTGISAEGLGVDPEKIQHRIEKKIRELRRFYRDRLSDAGVRLIEGEARVTRADRVQVGDSEFGCDRLVLAAGASPVIPDLENAELLSTNHDVFSWTSVPERLLIVGGGYIGCEFASIWNALGSEVTLITDGDRLLEKFDEEAVEHSRKGLVRSGVRIKFATQLKAVSRSGNGTLGALLSNGEENDYDEIICAIGRKPNIGGLGPIEDRLETADSGALAVDARFETSVAGVHAIGDIADRLPLTPVATRDGETLARQLFGTGAEAANLAYAATTCFLLPPIAQVGVMAGGSRHDAAIIVRKKSVSPLERGVLTPEKGLGKAGEFYKVAAEEDTGRILGVSLVADGAADMIAWAGAALAGGLTARDLQSPIGIHPSFGEEIIGR